MRIAFFDCFSGVSGDMCLGALVSAGWPREAVESLPGRIGLEGVRIEVHTVRRGPFEATKVDVHVEGRQPHRGLSEIEEQIGAARVPEVVRRRARAVFARLAAAEAAVHGGAPEDIHLHEVGAADALVDVLGTLEGLESLGVQQVFASAFPLTRGFIETEHGPIPLPAPATLHLLQGARLEPCPIPAELVTPTGAALLATLSEGWPEPPAYQLQKVGTGAGTWDLKERPNALRLLIGEAGGVLRKRSVAVLETALDDDNPQFVAALVPRLLEAGALDAMVVPTVMKKGRPGLWLVVIAETDRAESLASQLLRETSSLGVRVRRDDRYELPRRAVEVDTPHGRIALKVASLPDGSERATPEFESVRAAAERSARPLREVAEAALSAWRASTGGDAPDRP